jgi:hypothetical protein
MDSCVWLNLLGGLLEIAGFTLVAVELLRLERRELGTAGPFQFLVDSVGWVRRKVRRLLRREEVHEAKRVDLSGTAHATSSASARLSTGRPTLEDRVRVLEENFKQLAAEVRQHRLDLDQKIDRATARQEAALGQLREKIQEEKEREKQELKASLSLQWYGIFLFISGVAITVAANVFSCG